MNRGTLKGRGYLYQGAWLGFDPEAHKEIEILIEDISATEKDTLFTRVITRTGHTFIIFNAIEVPPVIDAKVIEAGVVVPALPAEVPKSRKGKKGGR